MEAMRWDRDESGIERALAQHCAGAEERRETVRPQSEELIAALPLSCVLEMAAAAA
jgi:hypothetical protein